MAELTNVHAAPDFLLACWESVMIMVWYEMATLEHLKIVEKFEEEFVRGHPGGISVLTIVRSFSGLQRPGEELRAESARLSKRFEAHVRGSVTVIEQEGMAAALARAFLAGVSMMSTVRMKVFKKPEEAVQWLAALPGQDPKIVAGVDELIVRLREGTSRAGGS